MKKFFFPKMNINFLSKFLEWLCFRQRQSPECHSSVNFNNNNILFIKILMVCFTWIDPRNTSIGCSIVTMCETDLD